MLNNSNLSVFLKLLNKIFKNGKKYKFYLCFLKISMLLHIIINHFKLTINNTRLIYSINDELKLNLPFFSKSKKKNIFLMKNKRLKELLKWFSILLNFQKFRSFDKKILSLIIELIFFFNHNIFSVIKGNFKVDLKKKRKKNFRRKKYRYLGNI